MSDSQARQGSGSASDDDAVTVAFARTTRSTPWRLAAKIPLRFPTHHPQGMTLVGDRIVLSTVEVLQPPARHPEPLDGHDRTPGSGIGHLLVLDRQGNLHKDVRVGADTIYHPGGVDFDGETVWVPVAEYRPNSRAVVCRFDPHTYDVTIAFEVADHVGAIVRDRVTGDLHGMSWGARTLHTWTPDGSLLRSRANEDHLIDYQDCSYAGWRKQICSGITVLPGPDGRRHELGGLALRDLREDRILHQIPFPHFSTAGHVLTRNPVALEVVDDTLRLLAAPDDGEDPAGTELFVYETRIG
ncbi:DUF6454 family protein [Actinopolymorpha pittospori]